MKLYITLTTFVKEIAANFPDTYGAGLTRSSSEVPRRIDYNTSESVLLQV